MLVRFWRTAFFLSAMTLLATELFRGPGFWGSYVRDVVGPALFYIFLRGLHRPAGPRGGANFFSAGRTALLLFGACLAIEGIQYLEWYSGYFDPYDLAAYGGGIFSCFILDRMTSSDGLRPHPTAA